MATNKPYNFDITTSVRGGYRFLRSVFKGKPAIFTAQDLNRQFEQIQAIQSKHSEDIGAVMVNVKFFSDTSGALGNTTTHTISSNDGINPMYVYSKGMRFTIPSTYSFSHTGADANINWGVYLIATRKVITYAVDSTLSGIDVPIVPYTAESSETIVYVDERIVYGDETTFSLGVGEEVICKIGSISTNLARTNSVAASSFNSFPPSGQGYNFLRPSCISDTELDTLSAKYTGSHFDYYVSLYDVTLLRLRSLWSLLINEAARLDTRIDATNSSINSIVGNIAYRDTVNKMEESTYYAYATASNVSVYDDSGLNPGLSVSTGLKSLLLDNTLGSNIFIVDVQAIILAGVPTHNPGGSYGTSFSIPFINLVDKTNVSEGYEVVLEFKVGFSNTRYTLKTDEIYSNAGVGITQGYPFRISTYKPGGGYNSRGYEVYDNTRLRFVLKDNKFQLVTEGPDIKRVLGYTGGEAMWHGLGSNTVFATPYSVVEALIDIQTKILNLEKGLITNRFRWEHSVNGVTQPLGNPSAIGVTEVTETVVATPNSTGDYLALINCSLTWYGTEILGVTLYATDVTAVVYQDAVVIDSVTVKDIHSLTDNKSMINMVVPFKVAAGATDNIKIAVYSNNLGIGTGGLVVGKYRILQV